MPDQFCMYSQTLDELPEEEMKCLTSDCTLTIDQTDHGLLYIYTWPDLVATLSQMPADQISEHMDGMLGYTAHLYDGQPGDVRLERILQRLSQTKLVLGIEFEPAMDSQDRCGEIMRKLAYGLRPIVFQHSYLLDHKGKLLLAKGNKFDEAAEVDQPGLDTAEILLPVGRRGTGSRPMARGPQLNNYEARLRSLGGHLFDEADLLPLAETDLVAIENRIRKPLPAEYREFVRHCGGYTVDLQSKFVERFPEIEARLKIFFGLTTARFNNLITEFHMQKGRLPANLLPIAKDEKGNLICIATSGPLTGAVYGWTGNGARGNYKPAGPIGENEPGLSLIAYSFNEFIDGLEKHDRYLFSIATLDTPEEILEHFAGDQYIKYPSDLMRAPSLTVEWEKNEGDPGGDVDATGLPPMVTIHFGLCVSQGDYTDGIRTMAQALLAVLKKTPYDIVFSSPTQTLVKRNQGRIQAKNLTEDKSNDALFLNYLREFSRPPST